LVEWLDKERKIKRDHNWYLIDDFLKNDSFKNINSGLGTTPDYGQIRIDTPSSSNIASYLPSVMNYNVPYMIYRVDDTTHQKSGEGTPIYPQSELNKMCALWFTRSISEENDISSKIDVYWVSEDWENLIWKDYFNSKMLNYAKDTYPEQTKEAIEKNNKMISVRNGEYSVYNYINYNSNLSNGVIWEDMEKKYGTSFQSSNTSVLQFSTKSWNWISFSSNITENGYPLLNINNDNPFITGPLKFETNGEKIFIKYKDVLNAFETTNIKSILANAYVNKVTDNVSYLLTEDVKNQYAREILHNDMSLMQEFLALSWTGSEFKKNIDAYKTLWNEQLAKTYGAMIGAFLDIVDITFSLKVVDDWKISFEDISWFDLNNIVGKVGIVNNEIGFNIYSKDDTGYKIDTKDTITYGLVWSSDFPLIKTPEGLFWLNIAFGLDTKKINNDRLVGLYNNIIWGRDLIFETTKDQSLSNVYWLLYHMNNTHPAKLAIKLTYNSPEITDFLLRYNINSMEDMKLENVVGRLYLNMNYFNNGSQYTIRDITGKEKQSNRHPFVFPISQIITKDDRKYSNWWYDGVKVLSDWEQSYFNVCLGDNKFKDLYDATPESEVYIKYLRKWGVTYAVTYKVLQIHFKYAWELSFWEDFGLFWATPQGDKLNVATFMNTNPLKSISYDWASFKIENFLSWDKLNIWSGFSSKGNDYSYGFRSFVKKDANVLKFTQNWGGAELWNQNPYILASVTNKLEMVDWDDFSFGNSQTYNIATIWGKGEKYLGDEYNYDGDLYVSPACPKWYDLYDDYVWFYKDFYASDLIKEINFDELTGYFNTPKPFCVHSSLPHNRDDVMWYMKKMFSLEENSKNLFVVDGVYQQFFSPSYKNMISVLFSTEDNKFPNYWLLSEQNKEVIADTKIYDDIDQSFGFRSFTNNTNYLVDKILLLGNQTPEKNQKLKAILNNLSSVNLSVNGVNILKTTNNDPYNFASTQNAETFPIIGSVMNIRKSWNDFYCKKTNWEKTNSIIINGNCLNKATGKIETNENVYINYGTEKIIDNGAFLNNTILYPLFKRYSNPEIPYTSWNLYLSKNKDSQGKLPFVSEIVYSSTKDDLNLFPRIVALGWELTDAKKIQEFYSNGYWVRASWFHFPYFQKALGTEKYDDFNNLIFNSSIDTDEGMECVFKKEWKTPDYDSLQPDWTCEDWFKKTPKPWATLNYLINRKSNTIWVKWSDYEVIKVPTMIGNFVNNDLLKWYASNYVLKNKAELIAGKPFSLFYLKEDDISKFSGLETTNALNFYPENEQPKYYGGLYIMTKIDNTSGGMNNNSVYYDVKWEYLNETCMFGDSPVNSCVLPYYAYAFETVWDEDGKEQSDESEGVCIDESGNKVTYNPEKIDDFDINKTWFCNASCTQKSSGLVIKFSHNLYKDYVNNLGDEYCKELPTTRVKLFDWYTFNSFLQKNNSTADLWRYQIGWNGNGVSLNSEEWSCIYTNEEDQKVKCYEWYLSRYNFEINKNQNLLKGNPWLVNSYQYINDIKLGKSVSTNFNSVFNNDAIILTNKTAWIRSYVVEGGYIGYNTQIVDKVSWWISNDYIFSDNDNLKGEWSTWYNNQINSSSKELRQERRDRIREQIKLSAWNSDDLIKNPTTGLNYLALKINKDDFYSLNGILRISKDSSKNFSNLKIHNPLNETQLLNSIPLDQTYYSYNNLVIKYGNKFYTWGNNDTNCNGINPNAVYNRVDNYSSVDTSREDTMTLCLDNSGKLSDKHSLANNLFILIPVKPTKGYNTYSTDGNVEYSNSSNSKIYYGKWYLDGYLSKKDTPIASINTYFQWFWANGNGNLDEGENFLDISNGSNLSWDKDRAIKGRQVDIVPDQSSTNKCLYLSSNGFRWNTYPLFSYKIINKSFSQFKSNKITINSFPKVFLNGFITKGSDNKVLNAFETSLSISKSQYTTNTIEKNTNTNWYDPIDYVYRYNGSTSPCSRVSEGYGSALNSAKAEVLKTLSFVDQKEIYIQGNTSTTDHEVVNAGNLIESFYIPEPENTTNYTNNITYSSKILDKFLKSWNLNNGNGLLANNGNFVYGSLSENNYTVSVWDYLQYEQKVEVKWDITPQNMFLRTQLDRWLDMDLDSLSISVNGIKQSPIYLENPKNIDTVGKMRNWQFTISPVWVSAQKAYELYNTTESMVWKPFMVNSNKKITATKWKIFLEVEQKTKVYSSKGTQYIKRSGNTLSKIFETNNWLVKSNDYSDIFNDLWSWLSAGDILVVDAWEYVRFTEDTQLKVLNYNFIPDYLLEFNVNKLWWSNFKVWINGFDSGFGTMQINPNFAQPFYIFDCSRLQDEELFKKSVTYLEFTTNGKTYCWVYNKYNDTVFAGYLNQMTSVPKLMLPNTINRFMYGDNDLLSARYTDKNGNNSITSLSRWERVSDKEKQLVANLGILKKWDTVVVSYKAKVNTQNYVGHRLYNYDYSLSESEKNWIYEWDTLLTGGSTQKDLWIYAKALNSQIFYLTHYGKEEAIFNSPLSLEKETDKFRGTPSISAKWVIEIWQNIDLSIINLSGRKDYASCNPFTEKSGNCDNMSTIENLNRDGEEKDWLGKVVKKDWESKFTIYKGQKFLVRLTNDNMWKIHNLNGVDSTTYNLVFDSNLLLFDGVWFKSNLSKDSLGNISVKDTQKFNISAEWISEWWINKYHDARKEFFPKVTSLSSYKKLNFIDPSPSNDVNKVYDFMFTAKDTFNSKEIKTIFENAYIKELNGLVIADGVTTRPTDIVKKYLLWDDNYAFSNGLDYNGALNTSSNERFFFDSLMHPSHQTDKVGNPKSFQYYNLPFTWEYKYLWESKNTITDLNPSLVSLSTRVINTGNGTTWAYDGTNDWDLYLEISLVNTSEDRLTVLHNWVLVSLPNGITAQWAQGVYVDDINWVRNNIVKSDIHFSWNKVGYRKTMIELNNPPKELVPWEKITYKVKLWVDMMNVDMVSVFNTSVNVRWDWDATIFDDTSINFEKGLGDLVSKSIPIFAENDVFIGWGYIKNKVNDLNTVNKNSWKSQFNVLGNTWAEVDYIWNNAKNGNLASQFIPKVFDMNDILDESKHTYSVQDLQMWTDEYMYRESWWKLSFQNNTLYYFGDKDVHIGDYNDEVNDILIEALKNQDKWKHWWITIFTKGTIYINKNVYLSKNGNTRYSDMNNIAFIWGEIRINPRVSHIEWFYIAPMASKSFLDKKVKTSGITYDYTWGIWMIRMWYSNTPLEYKWSVSGWMVLTERKVNSEIFKWNITEKWEYDFDWYLAIPPVIRKF